MTVILSGLAVGSLYAITAVGFNVVFVSAGLFNFAQAQFMMVGVFVAYWTSAQLHLPVELGFPLGAVIGFSLGALEDKVAIRPVMGKGAHAELVTTIGIAIVLDGVASVIWGTEPLQVPFLGSTRSLNVFGGYVTPVQLVTIGVAVLVPVAAELWSRHTLTGLASRAVSEDRSAAMVRGINVRRFTFWSVALAGAFAGALGPIVGPQTYAVYNIGDTLAITSFVALAIGGFGSYIGAAIGGFAIGIIEQVSVRYFSATYQDFFVFALLLLILMIRPSGLFRTHAARRI
jgi:branched-chain amino acid transport system permease protein